MAESNRGNGCIRSECRTARGYEPMLLTVAFFLAFSLTFADPSQAQINITTGESNYLVLPTPPREVRRVLSAAERSIANREYSDGVEALTELLDTPQSEDFFLPPNANGIRISLKKRALDLLGNMPESGREMYELEVGAEARRMLKEALQSGDIAGVREVSRRFFHTETGYQATMLLARSELDQGRPLAAVLHLQRLMNSPNATAMFDHELPFILAACWHLAGDQDATERFVSENVESLAGASVVLGGVATTIPKTTAGILTWLKQTVGAQVSFRTSTGENWTLARGNANRNGSVDGGLALAKLEWKMEPGSALSPIDTEIINDIQDSLRDESTPAISAFTPLAVGDQLLFRTARRMYGGNISEGRLVWEGPNEETVLDSAGDAKNQKQSHLVADARRNFLIKRMCQDAAYGQMSSDGQRLFLITGNKVAAAGQPRRSTRWGAPMASLQTNHLTAVELSSEGKMLWTTMDAWQEPVFFLGPPLPIEDELFAIVEIKDEIKLVSINPSDGTLLWSQQLAQVEAPFGASMDNTRRLAGAAPSFANGIMVCTTSSGAVVAVDIAARVLLWAHTYETGIKPERPIFGGRPAPSTRKPNDQWADSVAVIDEGYVIVTPVEADKLLCLDLLTGEPAWPAKKRKDMLFVGGIYDGVLVMVEKDRVRGIDVKTGEEKWEPVEFTNESFTSGRGFVSDGHYHFPVGNNDSPPTGSLLRIRFSDGKTDYHPTERVLGNLICHGDYMISQGLDGIFAYSLRDRKRDSVHKAIENNTATPDVLEDYANILASDGKRDEAIKVMRTAYEQEIGEQSQGTLQSHLLRMITDSLQIDFEKHQGLVEEANSLVTEPEEQRRLDNIVAVGLINIGSYDEALAAHLRLIDGIALTINSESDYVARLTPATRDSNWRVSNAINLSNHIHEILEESSDRNAALESIRSAIADTQSAAEVPRMQAWLNVIGNLDELGVECHELRLKLAETLLTNPAPQIQRVCQLLGQVARTADDEGLEKRATLLLAKAYESSHPQRALSTYEQISERWGADAAQKERDAYQANLAPPAEPWRKEKLVITRERGTNGGSQSLGQLYQVLLNGQSKEWPTGGKVFISSRPAEILIVDGSGQTLRRCNIGEFNQISGQFSTAKHYGHVLVVSLGDRLVAVDTLGESEEPLWVYALSRSQLGRSARAPNRKRITVPFVEPRNAAWNSSGSPYGTLGAIGDDGVCVMRGTELQCLDLQTGQPRWSIRDAGEKVISLFGDGEHCYVSRDATGETRVFEMRTGKETDNVKIPSVKHWATFGRFLLHYEGLYNSGRDLSVSLYDCAKQKPVWKQEVPTKSKARIINNEELVMLHPDGKLTIRRILDGELLLEAQVKPEKALLNIYAWKSREQYLIVTNHSDAPRKARQQRENIQVFAPNTHSMSTPLVCGHVYAFNLKTKELAWEPVAIDQYGLPSAQPQDSPMLVALRQVTRTKIQPKPGQRREMTNKCEVALLDRRTGLVTNYAGADRIRTSICQIVAEQENQTIRIQLPPMSDFVATFADPNAEAPEPNDTTPENLDAPNVDAADKGANQGRQTEQRAFLPVPMKDPDAKADEDPEENDKE